MSGTTPLGSRLARLSFGLIGLAALGSALAACSSSPTATTTGSTAGADASCSGVSGTNHVRVVVEASPSKVVSSCVGFSTGSISAVKALDESHIAFGTQDFGSSGLAVCSADDVPAHYTQCFSSTGPYWAIFTSSGGVAWRAASVGLSRITMHAGDSIGLRYDAQSGPAAKPPAPKSA